MKKFWIIFVMVFMCAFTCNASNVYEFKTHLYSHTDLNTGKWCEQETSGLTVLMYDSTITIYGPIIQEYKIITREYIDSHIGLDDYLKSKNIIINDSAVIEKNITEGVRLNKEKLFYVIDQDNTVAQMIISTYTDLLDKKKVYPIDMKISFKNFSICYNMFKVSLH